ncbi:MAG: hypothetical protein ACOY46_02800 [Bacillota bacterium]
MEGVIPPAAEGAYHSPAGRVNRRHPFFRRGICGTGIRTVKAPPGRDGNERETEQIRVPGKSLITGIHDWSESVRIDYWILPGLETPPATGAAPHPTRVSFGAARPCGFLQKVICGEGESMSFSGVARVHPPDVTGLFERVFVLDAKGRVSINRVNQTTAKNAVRKGRARWVGPNAIQHIDVFEGSKVTFDYRRHFPGDCIIVFGDAVTGEFAERTLKLIEEHNNKDTGAQRK